MASPEPARRYVVGIGVGDYDLPQLHLPQVAADVAKITAWFESHPRLAHERVLAELGASPTWAAMQTGLRTWLSQRRPDDVVVIYIAGHGAYEGGRAYLFGRDTPQQHLAGAALEAATLGTMLGQFKAHNVLVIVDACVAGKLGSQIQRAAEDAADEQNSRDPQRAWAQALVCSTYGRDPALDGRFAQAFLDVVSNEKWTGTTQPWIDIDQLMRGLRAELREMKSPQVADRKVWGPGAAELIPNPHYATRALGTLIAAEELAAHFDPSSRGVARGESGSFFSGRVQEMRRIAGWLRADGGPGGGSNISASGSANIGALMVLTGSPGSGKSALLSRAVVLSDPALRGQAGDLSSLPADSLPPLNAFGGVVWCRHKSLRQVVAELGAHLGQPVDSVAALQQAALGRRMTLAIDALDEALPGEAAAIAQQVIAPLAAMPGMRLLVATRRQPVRGEQQTRDLLDRMGALPAQTLVLDDAADREPDMRGYVHARLISGGSAAAAGYRADPALAERVAGQITAAAGSSFLVAAITAKTLAAADQPADARALQLPGAVGDAMAAYIDRLADPQRVRDVLRPLAWAVGAGLPWGELWPLLATALAQAGRGDGVPPLVQPDHADADVRSALDAAGDLIVESVAHGDPVYRLFHEALAEQLRRDMPAARAHAAIADALMAQAAGRPWPAAPPYTLLHLTQHLAAAAQRSGVLVQLVCDPQWERARRTLAQGEAAWLDDVDLTLQQLSASDTHDLRQIGLCLLYGRRMATAPAPVLEVLARAGQLQRAERMANNVGTASERAQVYAMLASSHAQVHDLESAMRCLQQAAGAAAAVHGTHAPMAWYRVCEAALSCRQMAPALSAAEQALAKALQVQADHQAAGDTWDVANALFWAALALRRVDVQEPQGRLRDSLDGLVPFRNLTLQLASVLGEADVLRQAFARFQADSNSGQHSSIRAGNLALALADAGLMAELEALLRMVPPQLVTTAGESDAQKRFVWALALAGRYDDALTALAQMEGPDEYQRAMLRIAEVAERARRTDVLDRLAALQLSGAMPREASLDALAARVLSLAGQHEAALAMAEDIMRRPQGSSGPATPARSGARRPLAADLARIDHGQAVIEVEQLLRAGQTDAALRRALAIGRDENDASAAAAGLFSVAPASLPVDRALALARVVPHLADRRQALGAWLEALRTARLAGHTVVQQLLQLGPDIVAPDSAGRLWVELQDELEALERRWDLHDFAVQYNTLRAAFGSGAQRTARMGSLMIVPRRQAGGWRVQDMQAVLIDAEPARRLFVLGLMRGNPVLLDPDLVVQAIAQSHSAFEQYHALLLADESFRRFDPAQQERLGSALRQELAADGSGRGHILHDSARRSLAEGLLDKLGRRKRRQAATRRPHNT